MTIFDMLDIWVEWSKVDSKNKLGFQEKSIGFQAGGSSWGMTFDEWEAEHRANIGNALEVLINGEGREKGILTQSEVIAINHNHVAAVWQSNRTNIDDDYATATIKLTKAMMNRGFYFG